MITIEKTKYPMTDDLVRRKLFWLLQRLSSYSLWQRKRDAWAYFAQKYEEALKFWPEEKSEGFDPESIVWIYEALRLYDEGLSELAMGNRQVWKNKTGEFEQLVRPVNLVRSFFFSQCHERWTQVEAYPPEVETLNKMRIAASIRGDNLLYPPQNNVCNFFDAAYLLNPDNYNWEFAKYDYPIFPKEISAIAERSDIIIKTDDPVPCDGIWEPVKVEYNHKLILIKTDVSGFKNLGAYNYFIRGMTAPRQVYESRVLQEGWGYRDVHWRLLWEDTRYCDGVIPDESDYFLDDEPGIRITCQSGESCPCSGRWATLAGGHQQFADINAGQLMPEAVKYQGDMFAPEIRIPATWSLLQRDDKGNIYKKSNDLN